jgi:dolichol-phosphate mannosyltransferase
MATFSLVVPTRDEAPHIISVCNKIIFALEHRPIEFEIIVIDDNSRDHTRQLVKKLAEGDKRIKLFCREHKKGLASAIAEGWAAAKGEILGVIDADLQHPPRLLSEMLDCLLGDENIDIVIASRKITGGGVRGWSIYRQFISQLAIRTARIFIPEVVMSIKDPLSGFFILRDKVISKKAIKPIGYKILLEVLAKGKYKKVCEVPYIFQARLAGKSKAGCRQFVVSFFHIIKLSLTCKKNRKQRSPYNVSA